MKYVFTDYFPLLSRYIDAPEDALQENILECLMFTDVTFKADFGPYKKGEKVNCLQFDFIEGKISGPFDDEGKVLKHVMFDLVPR